MSERRASSTSVDDGVEEVFELAVSRATALREHASLAERQAGVGERQSVDGLFQILEEMISPIDEVNGDADIAEDFQVPIKTPDAQADAADQSSAGLWGAAKEMEQTVKPGGTLGRHRRGRGWGCSSLLRHDAITARAMWFDR